MCPTALQQTSHCLNKGKPSIEKCNKAMDISVQGAQPHSIVSFFSHFKGALSLATLTIKQSI